MSSYGRVFKPFDIGPFTIIPEGEPATGCGIPIILGKKGAFGSGEHETTAACLEFLAGMGNLAGSKALDLGSGTGILAIAAVRLGAASVLAIDIDWKAAVSGVENIRLNDAEPRIATLCGELSCISGTTFDLILANIYAEIHLLLAPEMAAMTRPGGMLLLSGIPIQDKFDVQQRFLNQGCELVDSRIGEDFVTYLMRKPS
ncbi:ribosomal protein L11 methyltransferase [Geobacter sp. OR-1]|uniref:50S ribosomal protein L11 methyltransferase n=1 Tax=Geobacter sp. OR-1 TaxID=1266765 RepID=UPI000543CF74|nr:50S ribosomal protein L11 methyltransferase [Geobacter sp. OR-1]GAM07958.1 ribosomal protein L11 methyltransferase [Geobacter sp. OR-1]